MFPKHPYLHALLQNIVPWNDQELHGNVSIHVLLPSGVWVVAFFALLVFTIRTGITLWHYDWTHLNRRR